MTRVHKHMTLIRHYTMASPETAHHIEQPLDMMRRPAETQNLQELWP